MSFRQLHKLPRPQNPGRCFLKKKNCPEGNYVYYFAAMTSLQTLLTQTALCVFLGDSHLPSSLTHTLPITQTTSILWQWYGVMMALYHMQNPSRLFLQSCKKTSEIKGWIQCYKSPRPLSHFSTVQPMPKASTTLMICLLEKGDIIITQKVQWVIFVTIITSYRNAQLHAYFAQNIFPQSLQ